VSSKKLRYERLILKLSGEVLGGEDGVGFDAQAVDFIVAEIGKLVSSGVGLGLVLGGGNILRGRQMTPFGMERVAADQAGMIATVINGLVFREALRREGICAVLYSAVPIGGVVAEYHPMTAREALEEGRVVIMSGGTGSPYFTTDTAAVLRARELSAGALLKGTKVDGIYSSDPQKDPEAEFFAHISYEEVIARNLGVMDITAVSLAREGNLPIIIFKSVVEDAMLNIAKGEEVGSIIREE